MYSLDEKLTTKFQKIDENIYSTLGNYIGAVYDNKAKMYEKLVAFKLYNKIIWGTSPDDYKQFGQKAINSTNGILLDIGCGGLVQTAEIYLQTKNECVLSDNSLEMLKIAKKRLTISDKKIPENIKLLQTDAFNLPFATETFDTICSFGMIHLFDNKKDFVNEALRVLKKGGLFHFSTMTTKRKISKFYMKQLQKHKEFGELYSEEQTLSLFNHPPLSITSYMKGSMLFIEGKKS